MLEYLFFIKGEGTLEWKHFWCFHVINWFTLLSHSSLELLHEVPFWNLVTVRAELIRMNMKSWLERANHKCMTITIFLPSFFIPRSLLLSFIWTETPKQGCKIWIMAPLILQPYFTWTWNIVAVAKQIYKFFLLQAAWQKLLLSILQIASKCYNRCQIRLETNSTHFRLLLVWTLSVQENFTWLSLSTRSERRFLCHPDVLILVLETPRRL